jgi:hypothetical protein
MIISAEEFVHLRQSESREDYTRAVNDSAPNHIWYEVIERFPEMRKWVAHNKTIPVDILRVLATDEDPEVRSMVARKRNLSDDIFELLAQDKEGSVRLAIAYNKGTPNNVLKVLLQDDWERVVTKVNERLDTLDTSL